MHTTNPPTQKRAKFELMVYPKSAGSRLHRVDEVIE
jgi:hypothetical protein